jgi:hypothetical protein
LLTAGAEFFARALEEDACGVFRTIAFGGSFAHRRAAQIDFPEDTRVARLERRQKFFETLANELMFVGECFTRRFPRL